MTCSPSWPPQVWHNIPPASAFLRHHLAHSYYAEIQCSTASIKANNCITPLFSGLSSGVSKSTYSYHCFIHRKSTCPLNLLMPWTLHYSSLFCVIKSLWIIWAEHPRLLLILLHLPISAHTVWQPSLSGWSFSSAPAVIVQSTEEYWARCISNTLWCKKHFCSTHSPCTCLRTSSYSIIAMRIPQN